MRARLAGLLIACVAFSACVGQRPILHAPNAVESATGNLAVDNILSILDNEPAGPVTATYRIESVTTGEVSDAVYLVDNGRRSLTIGDQRFLRNPDQKTCNLVSHECQSGWIDQPIAYLGITSSVVDTATATRLRAAYSTRQSSVEPVSTQREIGTRVTDCVVVTTAQGAETFCVDTVHGVLGLLEASDVVVTLTGVFPAIDEKYFTASN